MRQDPTQMTPTRGTNVTDPTAASNAEGLLFEPATTAPTDGRG